jgi:hypothetical protein
MQILPLRERGSGLSMRSLRLGLAAALCLVAVSQSRPAAASYVDFTLLGNHADSASYQINSDGVTITVTPIGATYVTADANAGLVSTILDHDAAPGWGQAGRSGFGVSVEFSEPVQILSADIFDLYRTTYNECHASPCPIPSVFGQSFRYSVDGSASFTGSALGSASAEVADVEYPTLAYEAAGFWSSGITPASSYVFTTVIQQQDRQITFSAAPPQASVTGNAYFTENVGDVGLRALSFDRIRVPELSGGPTILAVAVLVFGCLLAIDAPGRRRRR